MRRSAELTIVENAEEFMSIEPVKSYRAPNYPTRTILDTHPELLRLLPKRWQG